MPKKSYQALLNDNRNLMLQVEDLSKCASFGITVRQAVPYEVSRITDPIQWVVFLDVDDMHGLNQTFGYEAMNGRIRRAMKLRAADALLRARWFSGDEFIVLLSGSDPDGFCKRIKTAFKNQEVGVTIAYVPYSGNLEADVTEASELVMLAKPKSKRNRRQPWPEQNW